MAFKSDKQRRGFFGRNGKGKVLSRYPVSRIVDKRAISKKDANKLVAESDKELKRLKAELRESDSMIKKQGFKTIGDISNRAWIKSDINFWNRQKMSAKRGFV